jgi:hypothetical protein
MYARLLCCSLAAFLAEVWPGYLILEYKGGIRELGKK